MLTLMFPSSKVCFNPTSVDAYAGNYTGSFIQNIGISYLRP